MIKIIVNSSGGEHLKGLLDDRFLFVNPEIVFNNKTHKPFDVYLNIDGNGRISDHMITAYQLLGVKCIGSNRYDKSVQHLILKSLSIKTPDTYFIDKGSNNRANDYEIVKLLIDIPDDTKLIIKMESGARGIGQMLIKKNEFIQYCLNGFSFFKKNINTSVCDIKINDLDDKLNDTVYKIPDDFKINESKYILEIIERYGFYIIQKYENMKSEYRYLYFFGEEPIIIKRNKNDNDWQANSCITGNGEHILDISQIPQIDKIKEKIHSLAVYLNVPFLSLDLYFDENDDFGILEFQMEFGIQFVPHNLLIEKINKSIINLINNG